MDIDPGKLDEMEALLRMAGMFALERGGTVSHLHLQVGLSSCTCRHWESCDLRMFQVSNPDLR